LAILIAIATDNWDNYCLNRNYGIGKLRKKILHVAIAESFNGYVTQDERFDLDLTSIRSRRIQHYRESMNMGSLSRGQHWAYDTRPHERSY